MGKKDSGGVGFLGLLTLLFIGLKLTEYIAWSWWWVLAPTWIPVAIGIVLIAIAILLKVAEKFIYKK